MDETKRPTGLVLAPFRGSWAAIHGAVAQALEAGGVDVVWLNGDAELDAPVATRIHEILDDADFVVADLTEANPNVMYEMGYAHALRKPVLPVVERRLESIPPALRGRLFFVYDRGQPEALIEFLDRWLERHRVESRIEEPVG